MDNILKKTIYGEQQSVESKLHDKDLILPQHQDDCFLDTAPH